MNAMILIDNKVNFLGMDLINVPDFTSLIVRFLLNIGVILILVRLLYYSVTRRKDYLMTYLLISSVIFLLCFLLENVKLEIGFALGLFAVFGIIRYRTDAIPIREMTYLFIVIGISIINALANKKISIAELLFTNLIIVLITLGYEKIWLLKHESAKLIIYEKIDLIVPEKYNELLNDLKTRTGIKNIKRVEIGRIDFLRDTCRLTIYYEETGNRVNLADQAEWNRYSNNSNDD
jgi:hypothetical protein